MTEMHLLDEGTIIKFAIKEQGVALPLADATLIELLFQKKDRETFVREGLIYGDPEDGIVYCLSLEGEIDQKGDWKAQVYIEYPSGKWHTQVAEFQVAENIVRPPEGP